MTKSEVQEILDDADINNDGKLDYNEVNIQSPVGCMCWKVTLFIKPKTSLGTVCLMLRAKPFGKWQ